MTRSRLVVVLVVFSMFFIVGGWWGGPHDASSVDGATAKNAAPKPVRVEGSGKLSETVARLVDSVESCVSSASAELTADSDSEPPKPWLDLPRSKFPFWKRVRKAGETIQLHELLRHVELNPRDREIPASRWHELSMILGHFRPVMNEASQVRGAKAAEELTAMIDRGETVVREKGRTGSHRRDYGVDFAREYTIARQVGDVVHFGSLESMPETRFTIELQRYLATEFASEVAAWFRLCECLTSDELTALIKSFTLNPSGGKR